MRKVAWRIGVVTVAIGALTACSGDGSGRAAGSSAGAGWAATLPAALERAQKERKLVMVEFETEWCAACKEFNRTTLADARVRAALNRVVPLKLDADGEGRELAERFGVDGFPTVVFLDERGVEVGRIPGLLPAGPFLEELEDVLSRQRQEFGRKAPVSPAK